MLLVCSKILTHFCTWEFGSIFEILKLRYLENRVTYELHLNCTFLLLISSFKWAYFQDILTFFNFFCIVPNRVSDSQSHALANHFSISPLFLEMTWPANLVLVRLTKSFLECPLKSLWGREENLPVGILYSFIYLLINFYVYSFNFIIYLFIYLFIYSYHVSSNISSLYRWTDYDPCFCCTNLLFIYSLFICLFIYLFIYLIICFLIFLVIFIIFLIFFSFLVGWFIGWWVRFWYC